MKEDNMHMDFFILKHVVCERICVVNGFQFTYCSKERLDFKTESVKQRLFYLISQFDDGLRRGMEPKVAARDVGGNVLEPRIDKDRLKLVHLDSSFADIDGAKESCVLWHLKLTFNWNPDVREP